MSKFSKDYDVIVVGAGVAGLSCATALMSRGLKVFVLEARSRAGGRVYSVPSKESGFRFELGAEFIHGADPVLLKHLKAANTLFYDVEDRRFRRKNNKLTEFETYWEQIKKELEHLNPERVKDRSIKDFLESRGKRIKPDIKPFLVSYLEGFHAADMNLMGEKNLAAIEQQDGQGLNQREIFRPLGGFDSLIAQWLTSQGPAQEWLKYKAIVQKVVWQKHKVVVFGKGFVPVSASRLVVTVPIGVLKAQSSISTIHFEPELQGLERALSGIHMGQVQRINFEFSERFWEKLTDKPLGFLLGKPSDSFNVWWTQAPLRTPCLVAWHGGPKAKELSQKPVSVQIDLALKTLSKLTGCSKAFIRKRMKSCNMHNWCDDPFSLGAYSYIGPSGVKDASRLRRPFEDTLFFAGEATADFSAQATVHGALHSGLRAARQIRK